MRLFLLILILVCIVWGVSLQGKVLIIQVVIPANLVPYYDWLMSFPGLAAPAEMLLPPERHPNYDTYDL